MKKNLFLLFFILCINLTFACDCVFTVIPQSYHKANIVAEITILNLYGNNLKDRTYKADVKFEKFFKGKSDKTTLNVSGIIGDFEGTACEFEFKKGGKYLIFLNEENEIISSCTPHYLLDENSYKSKISAAENLFTFLKNNTSQSDEFVYYFEENRKGKSRLSRLKNFNPKNNFGVYELLLNSDKKVSTVNIVSGFGDHDTEIANLIKKNFWIHPQKISSDKVRIALVYIPEYIKIKYRDHISPDLY